MRGATLRTGALAILISAATAGIAACDRGTAPPPTPAAEQETAAPALPSGATLLEGTYLFETRFDAHDLSVGMRFHEGTLARINRGVVTAVESFTVVEDAPGRVVIELRSETSPPKRRELIFASTDAMFDSADPDVIYVRVADADTREGSGLTE